MPRANRISAGDSIYHVYNRANAKATIFIEDKDYEEFLRALEKAKEKCPMKIYSFNILPNHWHLMLHTIKDGDLSVFMHYLCLTHVRQWHARHSTAGLGHLYQGRYKAKLVQTKEYALQLCRYIERNALRAGLVQRAEDWKWSSAWIRSGKPSPFAHLLDPLPLDLGKDYLRWLNEKLLHEDDEPPRPPEGGTRYRYQDPVPGTGFDLRHKNR